MTRTFAAFALDPSPLFVSSAPFIYSPSSFSPEEEGGKHKIQASMVPLGILHDSLNNWTHPPGNRVREKIVGKSSPSSEMTGQVPDWHSQIPTRRIMLLVSQLCNSEPEASLYLFQENRNQKKTVFTKRHNWCKTMSLAKDAHRVQVWLWSSRPDMLHLSHH